MNVINPFYPPDLAAIRAELAPMQAALPICASGQDWRRVKSIENGHVAALCAEVDALRQRRAELLGAIKALARGSCFCEMAVGNPMANTHSAACREAFEAIGRADDSRRSELVSGSC